MRDRWLIERQRGDVEGLIILEPFVGLDQQAIDPDAQLPLDAPVFVADGKLPVFLLYPYPHLGEPGLVGPDGCLYGFHDLILPAVMGQDAEVVFPDAAAVGHIEAGLPEVRGQQQKQVLAYRLTQTAGGVLLLPQDFIQAQGQGVILPRHSWLDFQAVRRMIRIAKQDPGLRLPN